MPGDAKSDMKWIVLQGERDEADGGMWLFATPFKELEDAKKFVEEVLRDEWCVMASVDGKSVPLADVRGHWEGESIKHSYMYYSEDGMEAWTRDRDDMFAEYKIKIVKLGKEGERAC